LTLYQFCARRRGKLGLTVVLLNKHTKFSATIITGYCLIMSYKHRLVLFLAAPCSCKTTALYWRLWYHCGS